MAKRRESGKVVTLGAPPEHKGGQGEHITLRTKEDTKEGIRKLVNLFFFFTGIIVLLIFSLYVALSSTLMSFTPVEGKTVWGLYGMVPHAKDRPERFIIASANSDAPKGAWARAKQSIVGVQRPFTAEVISEEYGNVSSKGGYIYVGDKKTSYKGTIAPTKLNGSFLVKCLEGNCKKGGYFIVPSKNVVGNIYGYITPHGIKKANEIR